jgi:hypothetical protein
MTKSWNRLRETIDAPPRGGGSAPPSEPLYR